MFVCVIIKPMIRIANNIFSLGISRILSGLILFFVYIRLVTYLGPDRFGQFSLVLAFYTIFLLFIDFGVSRYVIKQISIDKSQADKYLGNFLIAQLVLAFLILLIFKLIPVLAGYDPTIINAMGVVAFGLFLSALSIPFASILQAWQKIHLVAAVYFLNTLINAGWLYYAIFYDRDLIFMFYLYIAIGIVDLLLYAFLTKKVARANFRIDWKLIRNMFYAGLPFAFISGFEILIQKIDVVIQKVFLPFSEIGFYSSAYRFLDFLTFLPAVVAISLFPYFSERKTLFDNDTKKTVNQINKYLVAISLPIGVGSTLLAEKIILLLFDERYLPAVLVFQVLIWATVLTIFYAVPNTVMIAKKTKKALQYLIFATLLNVIANFIFVPVYGILASAWITVATYLFVAAVYIWDSGRISDFHLLKYLKIPLFASALMGIVLFYLSNLNLLVLIVLGALIYTFILILSGYLEKSDWQQLKIYFNQRS